MDRRARRLDAPDTAELQRRLEQAQTECARWACIGDDERLRETRFVAATLKLRIRHRRKLEADEAAGIDHAAAPAADVGTGG